MRAYKAVRALIADKEDTTQVFEIMRALSGRSVPKAYMRLLDSEDGGRLAMRRTELAAVLDDHDTMRQLPEGSVGRAYLAFVEAQNISADGLAQASNEVEDIIIDAEHPYAWFGRRLRDVHDIWHVLTGYNRDALGESCVVAFSYAQTGSAGFALIAFAGANELPRHLPGHPVRRAVWEAYRNGRAAAWLPGEDYEKLLAEPLEDARARLGIRTPSTYASIPEAERFGAMAPAGDVDASGAALGA